VWYVATFGAKTGTYLESNPIGLEVSRFSLYVYGNSDPIIGARGLAFTPTSPQSLHASEYASTRSDNISSQSTKRKDCMKTIMMDLQWPDHHPAGSTLAAQSDAVAKKARDQALAAGLTVTVYKDGQLIQEWLVEGKIKTLVKQNHKEGGDA
jgi:hypothetical protein